MTGLDPVTDHILEIATVITDSSLDLLADGPVIAIHQPDDVLAGMDAWNCSHHQASGLLDRVRASHYTDRQAEVETLDFIKKWAGPREAPLCGNSIWNDRRFLARNMPELEAYFHYHNIDVSTLQELTQRWAPNLPPFEKQYRHQALDDIHESIAELRHYRTHFFNL